MNAFTKKTLFAAIAGASVLGVSGAAQAVAVSANGMGEVLVYPYYTVKGSLAGVPYNTLLSIVNSTDSTKAVKIRFREGKASQEVLDFNIFLSPYDVWTGWLEPSAVGGTLLKTTDNTCTLPAIPAAGVEFRNFDYKGDAAKDDSLTRLQEGYFEVFEMATYLTGGTVATSAKHGSNGVPAACSKITNSVAGSEAQDPTGGLSGTVSLVEPAITGSNVAINATALNFEVNSGYVDTGSLSPSFADGEPWSVTPVGRGDAVWAAWGDSIDATSAAIMKNAVINEFVLDSATNSATSWVITAPTKHFYVPNDGSGRSDPFQSKLTSSGSCDEITIITYNREEQGVTPAGPDFSPQPEADRLSMCWEANVINFNGKNIFGSSNAVSIITAFQNGWMEVGFPYGKALGGTPPAGTHTLVSDGAVYYALNSGGGFGSSASAATFTGLPVIGFAAQTFRPGTASSYAGTFEHKWISGAPWDFFMLDK